MYILVISWCNRFNSIGLDIVDHSTTVPFPTNVSNTLIYIFHKDTPQDEVGNGVMTMHKGTYM